MLDFRIMPHKEFYALIGESIKCTYGTKLTKQNKLELGIKFRWYCKFIRFIIKNYNIRNMNEFESKLNELIIYGDDIKPAIKQYRVIKDVLCTNYYYVDVRDIVTFCERVLMDFKL